MTDVLRFSIKCEALLSNHKGTKNVPSCQRLCATGAFCKPGNVSQSRTTDTDLHSSATVSCHSFYYASQQQNNNQTLQRLRGVRLTLRSKLGQNSPEFPQKSAENTRLHAEQEERVQEHKSSVSV